MGPTSKIRERVRALSSGDRRRFLRLLGLTVSAPFVPAAVRFAANELAVGEAHAQALEQRTLFLELDLREQVSLTHVMVPPSIARHPNRKVGVNGNELAMFAPQSELKEYPNNVFLTNDSLELAPHIDTVAMLDTGEPGRGGVHGHEAACSMRSPGSAMLEAPGAAPLWLNDGEHEANNESFYGSVPTPASFHNYHQRLLQPALTTGFAFKGNTRAKTNVYHFGAGLPNAELTRVRSKVELLDLFAGSFSATPEPDRLVREILAATGAPYAKKSGTGYGAMVERYGLLDARKLDGLELTEDEIARWSEGVPAQQCSESQVDHHDCPTEQQSDGSYVVKAQIWEQFGYASKLLCSGLVRSIALEFDFSCLAGDGARTEQVMRIQAQQCARPVARLISDLKAAGLYERSLIAVYLVDGSRSPAANSYGDLGKGTILLAGGRIRGGYYGDIEITGDSPQGNGHSYALRPPDTTGELLPAVTDWADSKARTPSGSIWRTVAKAMGIPESEYVGKFHASVDDAAPLDFMLKA